MSSRRDARLVELLIVESASGVRLIFLRRRSSSRSDSRSPPQIPCVSFGNEYIKHSSCTEHCWQIFTAVRPFLIAVTLLSGNHQSVGYSRQAPCPTSKVISAIALPALMRASYTERVSNVKLLFCQPLGHALRTSPASVCGTSQVGH